MKTFKELVEASDDKKIISGAKSLADNVMDDLNYRIKDYFGDWPEDVVGKEAAALFYKTFYKQLAKNIKAKS